MPETTTLEPRQPYAQPPDIVAIRLDPEKYKSAECQYGAHHACPGGIRVGLVQGGNEKLYCQCTVEECACSGR